MESFLKYLEDKIRRDSLEYNRNLNFRRRLYKLDPALKKRRQITGLDKKK